MKRLIAIFALLFASNALAVDNPLTCTGAACKVTLAPKNAGGTAGVNVLTADGANIRVGVGTTAPATPLEVFTGSTLGVRASRSNSPTTTYVELLGGDSSNDPAINWIGTSSLLNFKFGGVTKATLNSTGALGLSTYGTGALVVAPSASGVVTSSNVWYSALSMANADCVGSPCSTLQNFGGGIVNITRQSAGNYTVNFTASFWSAAPVCTMMDVRGRGFCFINATTQSTTSVAVLCVPSIGGTAGDTAFNTVCVGPR